ncbi:hypothetical protein INR49_004577 [Caranx melampygus]|nr:hypothetical protein INR49_004577 [Caranx melampygus]
MTAMARPALLYFLLWLGVTLNAAMELEKRIIEGQPCDKDKRWFHVKLRAIDPIAKRVGTCSGSLIKDQWVLTAAHCLKPGRTLKAIVNFHLVDKQQEMTIAPGDIHKEENGHDIMLLKLPKEPDNPHSVNLPDDCAKDIKVGDTYEIAGYLHSADDTGLKEVQSREDLYCATLKAVGCKDCVYNEYPKYPKANWLCGENNKVEQAGGDSGSGAVVGNTYMVSIKLLFPPAVSTSSPSPPGQKQYLTWTYDRAKGRVTLSTAMELEKRIIGGTTCGNNERHYHVWVTTRWRQHESVCGGSLIRPQWVLTAAHCVKPGEGHTFQVAGLGINAIDANHKFLPQYPDRLQCINDVPVVPCGPAEDLIQAHCPVIPLTNAFCAHDPPRQTAPGDSGGGVLFNRKIYGIVAGGNETQAFVQPFYFVRVCSYRDWIERTVN